MLNAEEPKKFPAAISGEPISTALIPVSISGSDVAPASSSTPINIPPMPVRAAKTPIGEQGDPGSNGANGNINITMNLDNSGDPTTNGVKSSDFKITTTKCNTTMTNLNKDFNLSDDTYVYLRYNGAWKKILKSKWNHWLEHDLYS